MRRSELTLIIIGLACLTVGLYWPLTSAEFINFDDPIYVLTNSHVNTGLSWTNIAWAFGNRYESNWIPLTWISLMVDAEFFGLKAGDYHLTNIILHSLNTVLLFLWLVQWSRLRARSAIVALLFAVHPLHLESVAWVSERKDVLSTLFILLALIAYTRFRFRSQKHWLAVSCLAFACSLLAKQMYVTFPFLLLVLDYWPLATRNLRHVPLEEKPESNPNWKRLLLQKTPFFILSIAASATVYLIQNSTGAVQSAAAFPFEQRLGNALVVYGLYLKNTIWPAELSFYYPFPANGIPLIHVVAAGIAISGLSLSVFLFRRKCPYLVTGWFWFLGTLIPVIGIIQIGTQRMADRYMYFAQIGLFLSLIWAVNDLVKRWDKRYWFRSVLAIFAVGFYANETRLNIPNWKNSESLYTHALTVTDNNDVALTNLGLVYLERQDQLAARQVLARAIEINPRNAHAHLNLGTAYANANQLDQAQQHFQKAIDLRPEYALAYANLANVYRNRQQFDEAITLYKQAIVIAPELRMAYSNWGVCMAMQQQFTEAISHFEKAYDLEPANNENSFNLARAHYDRARQLIGEKRPQQALAHLRTSIRIRPDFQPAVQLLQQLSQPPNK